MVNQRRARRERAIADRDRPVVAQRGAAFGLVAGVPAPISPADGEWPSGAAPSEAGAIQRAAAIEPFDGHQTSPPRLATAGCQDHLFSEFGSRNAPLAYFDPRGILRLAARRRRARRALHSIDVAIDEEVQRARDLGVSWNEIASHLGISRQGARQHYGEGSEAVSAGRDVTAAGRSRSIRRRRHGHDERLQNPDP